jgi:hypothetical protein
MLPQELRTSQQALPKGTVPFLFGATFQIPSLKFRDQTRQAAARI